MAGDLALVVFEETALRHSWQCRATGKIERSDTEPMVIVRGGEHVPSTLSPVVQCRRQLPGKNVIRSDGWVWDRLRRDQILVAECRHLSQAVAQLPQLILGVKFSDGLEVLSKNTDRQPVTAAA